LIRGARESTGNLIERLAYSPHWGPDAAAKVTFRGRNNAPLLVGFTWQAKGEGVILAIGGDRGEGESSREVEGIH